MDQISHACEFVERTLSEVRFTFSTYFNNLFHLLFEGTRSVGQSGEDPPLVNAALGPPRFLSPSPPPITNERILDTTLGGANGLSPRRNSPLVQEKDTEHLGLCPVVETTNQLPYFSYNHLSGTESPEKFFESMKSITTEKVKLRLFQKIQ